MNLSPEVHKHLVQWVKEERSLSDIQKGLEEAGVKLTYMELRFLLDDLEIELPEKKEDPEAKETSEADPNATLEDTTEPQEGVSVEVDKITRPGAVASGTVQFSDGVNATWALDQMGRLMLDAGQEGYQPPAEDIHAFQESLQKALQGYS